MSAIDAVLARLDGVQRSGKGWRAKCPSCDGQSRKVSVVESDDGRVLMHCFGGCDVLSVTQALGLELTDLFPERLPLDTPEGRRHARRAARESQWGAALEALDLEAAVILVAGRHLAHGQALSEDDVTRLSKAVERVSSARLVLRDAPSWRPTAVAA